MNPDELEPRTLQPKPLDLETMGIDELEAYIEDLQAEIARARAAIEKKQSHRGSAESLFKG